MHKNTRTTVKARHCYAEAFTNYLRSGDLTAATRQVAHDIYLHRGNTPGTPQQDWNEAEKVTRDWPETITESSQAHLFDKAMSKTRAWLKDVENELGYTNPNEAYRALRAVLHAIRDRLPVEECAEFAAQLPTMIMGMYYAGWRPVNKPEKIRNTEEFLDKVAAQLPEGTDALRVTNGIIRVLERHISQGEMNDVRRSFPERMRNIWETAAQSVR